MSIKEKFSFLTWNRLNQSRFAAAVFSLLKEKVGRDSPEFTGVPTAPTAPRGTNDTQIATTEFVVAMIGTVPMTDTREYDLIIDSDEKFQLWKSGGTWPRVLIRKGSWGDGSEINLSLRGTKVIVGEVDSVLCASLYYISKPTAYGYFMSGVNVRFAGVISQASVTPFRNCVNLYDCTADISGTDTIGVRTTVYGFYLCDNLINCKAKIDYSMPLDETSAKAMHCFDNCNRMINCSAEEKVITRVNTDGISSLSHGPVFYCNNLVGCRVKLVLEMDSPLSCNNSAYCMFGCKFISDCNLEIELKYGANAFVDYSKGKISGHFMSSCLWANGCNMIANIQTGDKYLSFIGVFSDEIHNCNMEITTSIPSDGTIPIPEIYGVLSRRGIHNNRIKLVSKGLDSKARLLGIIHNGGVHSDNDCVVGNAIEITAEATTPGIFAQCFTGILSGVGNSAYVNIKAGTAYGFSSCKSLTGCMATAKSETGNGYGFINCRRTHNCMKYEKYGACTTALFRDCYASATINPDHIVADTANGGFNDLTN